MISLNFIALNNDIQVVRGSVWLVVSVESKVYLREYNVVGARFAFISKLNTLNKIMSLH
jgi:hypothetical protein